MEGSKQTDSAIQIREPKNPIPCNSGTVELYACCPSAGPAVRDGASPTRIIIIIILVIFLVSFFISFLLLASVFSLMRINQKHSSSARRWQMAITPSCNTLLDHSPSLFPFCWAIPHVRQRRNRSFPSQTKSPRHFLPQQTVGALEDDWKRTNLIDTD